MKMQFIVRNGVICESACKAIRDNYQGAIDQDELLQVDFSFYKKKRTLPQNDMYWAVLVTKTSQQLWRNAKQFSIDDVHEWFKEKFLPDECSKRDKSGHKIQKWAYTPDGNRRLNMSTTDLNTKEFADYFAEVEAYVVGELGIVI